MKKLYILRLALFCLLAAGLISCAKKPTSTADVPHRIAAKYKVAVAPFMQPTNPWQLISGRIPEAQGRIPADDLTSLDDDLRSALLSGTQRSYDFLDAKAFPSEWYKAHSVAQPNALGRWIAYGKEHDYRYILVPQVLDWHERQGSEAGVTESAHCRLELYLINTAYGTYDRAIFEEKQVGLIDDLFSLGDFVKRKGQWVTANQLADGGIKNAIRDLGL